MSILRLKMSILWFLLCFIFMLSMPLKGSAWASQIEPAETFEKGRETENGLSYEVVNDCIHITGFKGLLDDVEIPASIEGLPVKEIKTLAFANAQSLKSVKIPESVTTIEFGAFRGCESLESITIPRSVTSMNGNPAPYCKSLRNIWVESGNEHFCDQDGILFSKDMKVLFGCPAGRANETIWIPESVREIADGAFSQCSFLKNVIFANPYRIYSEGAVGYSTPKCVEYIGAEAFACCTSIKTFTVPASTDYIGNRAFAGCSSLTRIEFLRGAQMGNDVLSECTSLESIYFDGDVDWWPLLDLGIKEGVILEFERQPYPIPFVEEAFSNVYNFR